MKKIKKIWYMILACFLVLSFAGNCFAEVDEKNIYEENTDLKNESSVFELADEAGKYKISDFLGFYFYNTTKDIFDEYDFANPEVMRLYINKNGILERYSGMYLGTTGTSYFYTYDDYEIVSNTLICHYSAVDSYFGICEGVPGGNHMYKLGKNGDLIEGEDIWYKSSKREDVIWINEQNLNSLEEIYDNALTLGDNNIWYGYTDRSYGFFDIDGDGKIEAIEKGFMAEDYMYQFSIYKYDKEEACVKTIGVLQRSCENVYYSPKFQMFVTYSRTSTDDNYYFYEIDEVAMLDFVVYTYTNKISRWFGYREGEIDKIISEVPFGEWDDEIWDYYVDDLQEIQFTFPIQ